MTTIRRPAPLARLTSALVALLLFSPSLALAQASVLQGGSWTQGHVPQYAITGSFGQPVIQDGGAASGGTVGATPSELALTSRGTGSGPYANSGTGVLSSHFCMYDNPTSTASYHYLCMDPNAQGGGLLSYGAVGTTTLPLTFNINGTAYQFPFTGGYVVGPGTSVVGHVACWNNTAGTLLSDCGAIPSTTPGGSSGQIQYNNAGAFGGFTVSGDGTLNTGTGALTISKLNGVSATLGGALSTGGSFSTTSPYNLALTLGSNTNVTLPNTGTLSTLAGVEALTNKTVNGLAITSSTGTLTVANGKTFSSSNTLTLAGTDGSTLNIGTGGTLGTAAYTAASAYVPANTQLTASLVADVLLNNTGTYFDGPSVSQGSTGTWYASGTVTIYDPGTTAEVYCKLWDGTTVIASASAITNAGGSGIPNTIALSGRLATPAGNLRISCRDITATTGKILFNQTGNSKDATITAFRVN